MEQPGIDLWTADVMGLLLRRAEADEQPGPVGTPAHNHCWGRGLVSMDLRERPSDELLEFIWATVRLLDAASRQTLARGPTHATPSTCRSLSPCVATTA